MTNPKTSKQRTKRGKLDVARFNTNDFFKKKQEASSCAAEAQENDSEEEKNAPNF